MADKVFFHLEQMIPFFKELSQKEIFSEQKVQKIITKIKEFEYKINRKVLMKTDFISYLEYLQDLLSLIKQKQKELKFEFQSHLIVKLINGLYKKYLLVFKTDSTIWIQFLTWLNKNGYSRLLSQQYAKVLQLIPSESTFWIMAAEHELNNNNIQSARILLQRSLRLLPFDKSIWIQYFKLELIWISRLSLRSRVILGATGESDDAEPILTAGESTTASDEVNGEDDGNLNDLTKDMEEKHSLLEFYKSLDKLLIPRTIYRNAIKSIPNDLPFRLEFLDIVLSTNPESKETISDILNSLSTDFPNDPKAIDITCQFDLRGVDVEDPLYPRKAHSCIQNYKQHMESLPSLGLYFVEFLITQKHKTTVPEMEEYFSIILIQTFEELQSTFSLSASMYETWYLFTKNEDVLKQSLEQYPNALNLWKLNVKLHNNDAVFTQALKECNSEEIRLLYVQHLLSSNTLEKLSSFLLSVEGKEFDRLFAYVVESVFQDGFSQGWGFVKALKEKRVFGEQLEDVVNGCALASLRNGNVKEIKQYQGYFGKLGNVSNTVYKQYIELLVSKDMIMDAQKVFESWKNKSDDDIFWYTELVNN